MAFLIIQIMLFLAAGALSQGTSRSELRRKRNECYLVASPYGRMCYRPIPERALHTLFTKKSLDEAFANVSTPVCSTWSKSKTCFFQYLNKKCDKEQVKFFQEHAMSNKIALWTELLCTQPEEYNLLDMFKQAAVDDGLGDCLSRNNLIGCLLRSTNKTLSEIPFKELTPLFFECAVQPIKNCAGDDNVKEQNLLDLMSKFEQAMYFGYESFWNDFKSPVTASTLLELLK